MVEVEVRAKIKMSRPAVKKDIIVLVKLGKDFIKARFGYLKVKSTSSKVTVEIRIRQLKYNKF